MPSQAELAFHASQSVITDPGGYADMYAGLPSGISGLCKVVQGNLIHVFHASRQGVTLTQEEQKSVGIRRVEEMLKRVKAGDPRPLRFPREPGKRLAANCRGFAVLLASLLRHQGIPARVRCGFETYYTPGWHGDHWVCQYWSAKEKRWVWVDPQVDDLQRQAFHLDFDTCDMPPGKFLPAGEVWALVRAGKLDPERCGIGELHGAWYVKGNVIRDFLALNGLELLPWDCTESMAAGKMAKLSPAENALNARLAAFSADPDANFVDLRALYRKGDPMFRMPEGWEP